MLTDLPQLLGPRVGHWLAVRLGLSDAFAFFCHHCPRHDWWGDDDMPDEDAAE